MYVQERGVCFPAVLRPCRLLFAQLFEFCRPFLMFAWRANGLPFFLDGFMEKELGVSLFPHKQPDPFKISILTPAFDVSRVFSIF